MAISDRNPNQVMLYPGNIPPGRIRNDLTADAAITPGMLVERHASGQWGVHDSANEPVSRAIALDEPELNHAYTTAYSSGDLMKVGYLRSGDRFYGIVASGQNVAEGALLQSNGDGKLKAYSTGVGGFIADEAVDASSGDTRGRIEVL